MSDGFFNKKSRHERYKVRDDVSMGYEKDIFGSFAYDFELSQKLIFG